MSDPFDLIAGWIHETILIPLLYALGLMRWEELAYGWALFAVYGVVQVALTVAERAAVLEREVHDFARQVSHP